MKKSIKTMVVAALALVAIVVMASCVKEYHITVSNQDLLFSVNEETLNVEVTANCKWTVALRDTATWYTVTPMSGKNDGVISVSVKPMTDTDYRGTTIVVESPGAHIRRTIFISQSKLNFSGVMNKVFGVMTREKWNTDYANQMIEDSYRKYEYNPYDSMVGYWMYFYEGGIGLQRDHHTDTVAYWVFHYEYKPNLHELFIEFEDIDGAPIDYNVDVLAASDSLFRFMHEYEPHWWERADMRKIGTIHPRDMQLMRSALSRRKGRGPIFLE